MERKRSRNLVGLVVCAGVAVAAPPIGGLISVALVHHAFEGTGAVEPSQKARLLAERISDAMNGAAAGLCVSLVALAAAVVFVVRLVRARRSPG